MSIPQIKNMGHPFMNLVRLRGVPILRQLHLEEQLLRTSSENWCIINDGKQDPTIVMGVSGKPSELLELDPVIRDQIPVIRRFTGGGTVIVDSGTIFVTFICNKETIPGLQPYPRPIMSWSSLIYKQVFRGVGDFSLRENDYVFGNRKFGGNAQSITKTRWIHHTSFLWDYEVKNMAYLKIPTRVPEYRSARDHLEFVCRMKDYLPRSAFIQETKKVLGSHFLVTPVESDTIKTPSNAKFEPTTRLLTNKELKATTSASLLEIGLLLVLSVYRLDSSVFILYLGENISLQAITDLGELQAFTTFAFVTIFKQRRRWSGSILVSSSYSITCDYKALVLKTFLSRIQSFVVS